MSPQLLSGPLTAPTVSRPRLEVSASTCGKRATTLFQKEWLRLLLLGTIGFLVHLPALNGPLIWDDAYLVRDNPFVKSPVLALEAFRHYLYLDSSSAHYRPVQNLSFMVDYFFWNSNTYGFHLTNVFLHVASGLLLYLLLRKLLPGLCRLNAGMAAFLIALVWMVHPVHSAAVDYISGRADSLAFAFAAGGWLLFLRGRSSVSNWRKLLYYLAAAFSAVLALCSRETALVWMFLFLAHRLFFSRSTTGKAKLTTVIGATIVLVIYFWLHSLPGPRLDAPRSEHLPAALRAVLMVRALGDYSRLMLWPGNLHMERSIYDPSASNDSTNSGIGYEYLGILGAIAAVALAVGCVRPGRARSIRIFGALWFCCSYLPISNIVWLNATVAEHWLYLPSVGFLIFVSGCIMEMPRASRQVALGCACLAIAALSARSWIRSADWQDEERFYTKTLAAGGVSGRVLINFSQVYARTGRLEEAEKVLRRWIAIRPADAHARNTLAAVLDKEGKKQEAETLFSAVAGEAEVVRKSYPRSWLASSNMARMRVQVGDTRGAIAILEKTRAEYPAVWDLIVLESELLRETGAPSAALQLIADFNLKNWWHYGAVLAAGKLYGEQGDIVRSVEALRRAATLDVHDVVSLNLLAAIQLRQNRLDEAFATERRAIRRQPFEPRQYLIMASICEKMGRADDAKVALAEVTRLQAFAKQHPEGSIAN